MVLPFVCVDGTRDKLKQAVQLVGGAAVRFQLLRHFPCRHGLGIDVALTEIGRTHHKPEHVVETLPYLLKRRASRVRVDSVQEDEGRRTPGQTQQVFDLGQGFDLDDISSRATRPKSRSGYRWCNAGSWRACATAGF